MDKSHFQCLSLLHSLSSKIFQSSPDNYHLVPTSNLRFFSSNINNSCVNSLYREQKSFTKYHVQSFLVPGVAVTFNFLYAYNDYTTKSNHEGYDFPKCTLYKLLDHSISEKWFVSQIYIMATWYFYNAVHIETFHKTWVHILQKIPYFHISYFQNQAFLPP